MTPHQPVPPRQKQEATGGMACPICNGDTPHEHDARTVAAWRSVSKTHGKPFAAYELRLRLWLVYGSNAAEALGIGATVEAAWWSAYQCGTNALSTPPSATEARRDDEALLPVRDA